MKPYRTFLLGITIVIATAAGAAAETRTASWDPVTTYIDNTPIESWKTVTYTLYWTTDAGLSVSSLRTIVAGTVQTSAAFDPDVQGMPRGQTIYFTLKTVLSTGEQSALAPPYAWTVPPLASPPSLVSLSISGPSSVNEGGTAAYAATATWSDNTTTAVAPAWSVSPANATIDSSGVLTAGQVSATQTVTVAASYTSGGVTRSATKSVSIVNVPPSLVSLSISGPSSVNEGSTATYAATATWSDNTTTAVTPVWSVSPANATIDSSGVLTAGQVSATQTVTVAASYTSGGVTRSATKSVSVVNVPDHLPAPPGGITISGPIRTEPSETWLLSWTAPSTYADGALLEPGRTIRHTAYWSPDSKLSADALHAIVTLTSATSVEFDPAAQGMYPNQRVYLAVRATLDDGAQSALSQAISWRVSNPGPAPPAGGKILKQSK